MSLFDRLKEKVSAAGKGAQKLTRIGQLKLDLSAAGGELSERYKALGKACAHRMIDRGESKVDAAEGVIATYIEQILAAQKRIQELEADLKETRAQ